MGQALADALRRAKKANEELKPTIERVKEVVKCPEQVKMDLWEGGGSSMDGKVNFEVMIGFHFILPLFDFVSF